MSVTGTTQPPRRCAGEPDLSRAFSLGPSPELSAHLGACAACGARWHRLQRTRELARQLPWPAPTAARLEQTRTALLVALARQQRVRAPAWTPSAWLRRLLFGTALAAAGVGGAALVLRHSRRPEVGAAASVVTTLRRAHHVTISPGAGARFERAGEISDQIVRLHDGATTFEVTPLAAGERFRVLAGNGEIEVRGTRFEVKVAGERFTELRVHAGQVELRLLGRAPIRLEAGDEWSQELATTDPAARAPGAPGGSVDATRASETAFVRGWTAFRAGQWNLATSSFDDVLRLAPTGPLADDARYWRATALARAGAAETVDRDQQR
jgi:TolA-binding protein